MKRTTRGHIHSARKDRSLMMRRWDMHFCITRRALAWFFVNLWVDKMSKLHQYVLFLMLGKVILIESLESKTTCSALSLSLSAWVLVVLLVFLESCLHHRSEEEQHRKLLLACQQRHTVCFSSDFLRCIDEKRSVFEANGKADLIDCDWYFQWFLFNQSFVMPTSNRDVLLLVNEQFIEHSDE